MISFKSGQLEDAEEYFAKVVELYPESGSAQLAEKNLENLLEGTQSKKSANNFFKRWNYDDEQKIAIAKSINAVADS